MNEEMAREIFEKRWREKFPTDPEIDQCYRGTGGWNIVTRDPKGFFTVTDQGDVHDPGGVLG